MGGLAPPWSRHPNLSHASNFRSTATMVKLPINRPAQKTHIFRPCVRWDPYACLLSCAWLERGDMLMISMADLVGASVMIMMMQIVHSCLLG